MSHKKKKRNPNGLLNHLKNFFSEDALPPRPLTLDQKKEAHAEEVDRRIKSFISRLHSQISPFAYGLIRQERELNPEEKEAVIKEIAKDEELTKEFYDIVRFAEKVPLRPRDKVWEAVGDKMGEMIHNKIEKHFTPPQPQEDKKSDKE